MVWYGMVSMGVGFPMHLDLDVVHCAPPMKFQISRHTLSSGAMHDLPAEEQWYPAIAPFCF
jgi:hypothetical protein